MPSNYPTRNQVYLAERSHARLLGYVGTKTNLDLSRYVHSIAFFPAYLLHREVGEESGGNIHHMTESLAGIMECDEGIALPTAQGNNRFPENLEEARRTFPVDQFRTKLNDIFYQWLLWWIVYGRSSTAQTS